ncbi:ABC-type branched-chain amino acid transport system, periplasmic component [Desulfamplus magnetovallimortis]|uniref:ABC-type branched-chain amino acid transport system, periplasmic component n=1 Tax=Desulfamplus magnetovallimortis TaxID=1246637 RepID=A0A1W1HG98_9BACT|nr:ABC transporter substrate-binding protein [Desulfamplus magnetovallimortis]SLM31466.1 ABC-type branched-chain amino acid transport system, periplasmic component [Desulfamplus magnetovallimortis]
MKTGRRLSFIAFAVASLLIIGGTTFAADKTLKIGVLGPFTGPSAQTGKEFQASVEMAMEKIDSTVGDYKIEVVWVDSQSDPAKASSAYAEAVEGKGIQAGVLNWHSSVAVAVMDVAAQYKIPHMFGFGASEVVNEKWLADPEKYSYWGGKGWPVPAKLEGNYIECLNAAIENGTWKPAKKLAAIYGEDTDWGRSAGGAYKQALVDSGWEIYSEEYFPITQTDFYPLLSKYKKAGVELLCGTSASPPALTAFVKQFSEVGLKSTLVASGLGWIGDWYKMTGRSSDYVLDSIPQLTTPEAQQWAKDVNAKFGFNPSPSAGGLSYDGINMFIKLLNKTHEKYGELNKETIHKTMVEEVNTGKLTYGRKDGAVIMNEYRYNAETMPDMVVASDAYFFPILQYKEGKASIIYPDSWKVKDFEPKK